MGNTDPKPGNYTVRGTSGPGKTEPVEAMVFLHLDGKTHCGFTFRGTVFVYRPRFASPHPERVEPRRAPIGIQAEATSIAREAFKAAKEAAAVAQREAENDARDRAQEGMSLDDIVLGGVSARSMGVAG